MKKLQLTLLVVLTLGFVTNSFSQKGNYAIQNGFGIGGGLTQFNIVTDNFTTKSSNGFLGGLSSTVNIPLQWYDISFGMQLSENNIEIMGSSSLVSSFKEFIAYKMFAAQVAMLMHIKVIPDYFTIELGPMLQYNGKLELKENSKKGYIVDNYVNFNAEDISNISQFNINGAIGATVGIKNFKLKAQYIYGFTNILKKLNSENLQAPDNTFKFKGNQTMLVLGAAVLF
ncbi:hypothetical protein [Gelatiniphilus marinus]|uniref:Outer membrane protein beta-barrel domain-containing protein n=1 Tax=Gelatiniphilus marinus TaxID=1759464 RepID=A0ABW5JWG3_9FLAO